MKMDENRIDEMFREAANGFEVDAPSRTWDRISGGLDRAASLRRIVWYRRIAAVAAVMLAFFVGYYFPGRHEQVVIVENAATPLSRVVSVTDDDEDQPMNIESQTTTTDQDQTNNKEAAYKTTVPNPSTKPVEKPGNNNEPEIILATQIQPGNKLDDKPGIKQATADPAANKNNPRTIKNETPVRPVSPESLPAFLPDADPLAEGSDKPERRVNWRLGGVASPAYAYRNLETVPSELSSMALNATEEVNVKERPILSYSLALTTAMEIGDRLSFESGLQFSRMGQTTDEPLIQYGFGAGSKAFTSAGMVVFNEQGDNELDNKTFITSDPHYSGELVQQFDYLEVPLLASYKIINKKLDMSVYAGGSAGMLVRNNAFFIDGSGEKVLAGYTYDLNRFVFGGVAGIGLEYPIIKKLSISLSPGLKYMFTPLNDYSSLGNHQYSFTMKTGLQYRFGAL